MLCREAKWVKTVVLGGHLGVLTGQKMFVHVVMAFRGARKLAIKMGLIEMTM